MLASGGVSVRVWVAVAVLAELGLLAACSSSSGTSAFPPGGSQSEAGSGADSGGFGRFGGDAGRSTDGSGGSTGGDAGGDAGADTSVATD
jgi:hypothetical protein